MTETKRRWLAPAFWGGALLLASLAAGTVRHWPREPDSPPPVIRIPEAGRLSLDRGSLPTDGRLMIVLALGDEARGIGRLPVRVVSEDGRRLEVDGRPMPGAGSGLAVELDAAFLATGRTLIEVSSAERHPLNLRRYVIELR